MGACLPCLNGDSADYDNPSPETRRRQQAEAAERRAKATESHGIKDPEALKRKQKRLEQLEKEARQNPTQGEGLRWQVG